jgi:hypothetical protein
MHRNYEAIHHKDTKKHLLILVHLKNIYSLIDVEIFLIENSYVEVQNFERYWILNNICIRGGNAINAFHKIEINKFLIEEVPPPPKHTTIFNRGFYIIGNSTI